MRIPTLALTARRVASLVALPVLALSPALVPGGAGHGPDDDGSRVCAGTGRTVLCVPPEELPRS